jgi:hypothetical protein
MKRLKNNRVTPLAGQNLDEYDWDYDDDQTLFYSLPPTSAYNHQQQHLKPDETGFQNRFKTGYPPVPDYNCSELNNRENKQKQTCDGFCDYFMKHNQKIFAFV